MVNLSENNTQYLKESNLERFQIGTFLYVSVLHPDRRDSPGLPNK